MADAAAEKKNMPALSTGGKTLAIVPQSFAEIVQIAGAVIQAGMNPKSLDTTAKVTIAVMHGLELGLTPMAALSSIAVVNGNAAVYGDGMLALIRASGHLEDIKESVEWAKDGPASATCEVKRKGETTWGKHTFTRDDAIKAGLWKKAGPWTQYPQRMMQMRSRAWALRDKFADVLRGLRSAEELEDMVDVTGAGSATTEPAEPQASDPKYQTSPAADSPPGGGNGQPASEDAAGARDVSQPEVPGKPAPITDVTDQNEAPQETTFENYKKIGDFFTFSDTFLQDPKRTVAEAQAWQEFYREYLAEKGQHKNKDIREAVIDTLMLYDAILKRGREPGEEG